MKKTLVTLIVAVSAFAGLVACGNKEVAETTATTETKIETTVESTETTGTETTETETAETETAAEEVADASVITVEVKDAEGNEASYSILTTDAVLLDALNSSEEITIEGTEEEWGFYVTTVNGVYADYDNEGAYWALYVNGEYGMYGVSEQPVVDGDVYTFQYEVYQAQ